MTDSLTSCRAQILLLNSKFINSEIGLHAYNKEVEALFRRASWQERVELDELAFSRHADVAA